MEATRGAGMSRRMSTPYIQWAKTHQAARFNLAVSGAPHASFDDIGGPPTHMPVTGNNAYGYAPLLEAIATTHDVSPEQVVTCTGCSMANFLALTTLIEPGDEVVIERPTYEPLLAAAEHLGASIRRVDRPVGDECRLDPRRVVEALTPRTRVVVLANLHNPSGQIIAASVLREIGEAAHHIGARVLVDEVYLDAALEQRASSVHLGPAFIVTTSLTKVYGLAALRCGWIIADEEFARRAWRVADLHGNVQPFAPDWIAARAFPHLPSLRQRTRTMLDTNRAAFAAWAERRTDITYVPTAYGTTICLKPIGVEVSHLCAELRSRYEVSVVPGRFFELPAHVRVGLTVPPETFREGLERIDACLRQITPAAGGA